MEIVYDIAIFVVQLIAFFSVMILAFLAYDLISTCVRRWWFAGDGGDGGGDAISLKFYSGSASGKDSGCGCGECECEWPCICDDIAAREDQFYKELDAMAEAEEAREAAEREFWERREVLVELWEPKAGDDLQCQDNPTSFPAG